MSEPEPRVTPLEPDQWSDEVRAVLGGTLRSVAELEAGATSPRPLNILMTIAHQPHLLAPFLGFAAALATRGLLPRRESELLALRTAWNCQSAFEWGHHVLYARAAGLQDAEIEAIALAPEDERWSPADRALLRAADELHETQNMADTTWRQLRERWDSGQLVEITFVVGNYTMLSMLANATGVPLESNLPRLPDRLAEETTGAS
jgi:4-carboxymuconolactone decarboxylase